MMGNKQQNTVHYTASVLYVVAAIMGLFIHFMESGFTSWLCFYLSAYCFIKLLLDTEPVDMRKYNAHNLCRKEIDDRSRS
jgi:hypothetical protein